MNLNKALKVKKKLIAKIARELKKFQDYNSIRLTDKPPYNVEDAYNNWIKSTQELVDLKTAIIVATAPVYNKIFRMAECKNIIQQLKNLNVTKGDKRDRYSSNIETITYVAFMDIVERDTLIIDLEEEIDNLQNELETFNNLNKI